MPSLWPRDCPVKPGPEKIKTTPAKSRQGFPESGAIVCSLYDQIFAYQVPALWKAMYDSLLTDPGAQSHCSTTLASHHGTVEIH